MDKTKPTAVLDRQFASFVRRPYAALVAILGQPQSAHASESSGTECQIEFNAFMISVRGAICVSSPLSMMVVNVQLCH